MFEFLKKDLLEENAALKSRINELQRQISSIAAAMIVVDKDLVITSVNDAALKAMGYSREEVVGKMTCAHFTRTPLCGTSGCTLKNCMRTGGVIYGETVAETRTGQKVPIKAACSALMEDSGKACGGIEVIIDQTDVSKAKWETDNILKSIAAPMFIVDKDLVITSVNNAALSAMGYSSEEVVGKMTCAQFSRTPLCGTSGCTLKNCMRTGEAIHGETVAETRSGQKIPIKAACSPLMDESGKPYGGIEVIIDISEIKRLQNEASGQKEYLEKQVNMLVENLERLSEGDLSLYIKAERNDEIGQVVNSINKTVATLREIVDVVKAAANNVASGSQELSSSSEQMSQGATEQASSVQEVSSSMEEMSANIRQNADNAQQTERIAVKSADDAKESGKAVAETVSAMKEIAGKISIIEEIARQTNLLALNAAIEAARAGEHGKGFAVVASEVRKLAERSQTAAAEISDLSTKSVQIAAKAGEMLTKLVPDIQKTAELVQEISSASSEQNTGAEQINKAVQQLDQVIQQNAGASEEVASTAEELSAQAEQLQAAMEFFKATGDRQDVKERTVQIAEGTRQAGRTVHGKSFSRGVSPESRERRKNGGVALKLVNGQNEADDEYEHY